jgi:superfamily II DNA or RNA helicase
MNVQDKLQDEFVKKSLTFYKKNKSGYLNLAMRFGKCKTTIEILKKKFDYDCTLLVAYPDNKLRDTWMNECELWGYTNPNITYVNFSSVKKYTEYEFDFFIIDEFHSVSENEREICKEIIDNCTYTLCLSGTVSPETVEQWEEIKEIGSYTTDQGIEDGILADYQISVHLINLDTKKTTIDKNGKEKTEKQKYDGYSWVIEKLQREGRNFMHLALARNRLSQSSVAKMSYLKGLLEHLSDKRVLVFTGLAKVADEVGCPSYHSKSKNDGNFQDFKNGEINHLALAAMGKIGVTYPDLDSVILTNFTYNAEESSQILNRAIKLDYHGKIADLHILCLNEKPELKKIVESLSMLNQSKIKYV